MQEIKCPNCGEVFQVDESGYQQIVMQIRDKEFEKELERREQELLKNKDSEIELMRVREQKEKDAELAQKDAQIAKLTGDKEAQIAKLTGDKDAEIARIKGDKDAEIARMSAELEKLKAQIDASENTKKLAVAEALSAKENELSQKDKELSQTALEIQRLKGELISNEKEYELKNRSIVEQYEDKLKVKDEQVAYYKDFKARQSTKLIGETLEQHCMNTFNQIRMTAFPDAYFDKDNEISESGSKGDFVFRDYDDGTEYISIMFEMKNENDETKTKHKNEDFFKELDKDRREKGCEYAVLVSLLEIDNDFYNAGIVDVSYRYPKMYVVRPQCFISIISLLRDAARNSINYKKELEVVKNQQIDVNNFEDNMRTFKEGFARNYRLASEKFTKAIEEIDKTIDHLQKTKAALLSSEDQLRLANNKAEDLSIKKLTKNAPSVREMFENQKNE